MLLCGRNRQHGNHLVNPATGLECLKVSRAVVGPEARHLRVGGGHGQKVRWMKTAKGSGIESNCMALLTCGVPGALGRRKARTRAATGQVTLQ